MRSFLLLTTFVASALLAVPSLAVPFDAAAQDVATLRSLEEVDFLPIVKREAEYVASAADVLYTRDLNEAEALDSRSPKHKSKKEKKKHHHKEPKVTAEKTKAVKRDEVEADDAEEEEDSIDVDSDSLEARSPHKKHKTKKEKKHKELHGEKPKKITKVKKTTK